MVIGHATLNTTVYVGAFRSDHDVGWKWPPPEYFILFYFLLLLFFFCTLLIPEGEIILCI